MSAPYPRTLIRLYLGGFPAYYLFSDLPGLNFQNTLSSVGTTLIFFSLGLVSLLLLTRFKVVANARSFWLGCLTLLHWAGKIAQREPRQISPSAPKVYTGLKINHLPEPKKKLAEILQPGKKIKPVLVQEDPPPKKEREPLPQKKEPIAIPIKSLMVRSDGSYKLPSPNLLADPTRKVDQPTLKKDLMNQAAVLEDTLKSFGIEAKVGEINSGPTITSFEVHPSIGVKVQKIKALENDIALNMQAKSIRIVAPIPGKAAVGVEVPALHPQEVSFKEMLLHYQQKTRKLTIPDLARQSDQWRMGLRRSCENAPLPHRRSHRIGQIGLHQHRHHVDSHECAAR